ncbi:hypothetical protein C8A01DRAFT_35442 [Parachaetomium inaequale]|uniref:Uncharacterized protein n=1 Tax=Parachaetomium inaequale TaxID=2588326 RepID=A0AAN6PH02_9PEZI|nr:hypothetical protein C8A01DRAFT_35442 [Parachaetomium inaequale]
MAEDLRRTMAKSQLQSQVRCPVIVGGDSMFRTPEDLRHLCQLPSVPMLTQTTETTLSPFDGDKEQDQDKETLHIADVSLGQYLDLQDCTEGNLVVVWFQGNRRFARMARSLKRRDAGGEMPTGPTDTAPFSTG